MNMAASTGQQKMTISDLEAKWKDVPDKYLITIAHILAGHINETEEFDRFNGPMLKASIKSVYWIFLIQYAALAILGITMNMAIVVYILYHRLYKDVTQAFICNLALCHFVQCAIVLPITLMVMLIQNWIFGQFLCFFLPMLQDIPLHVALISHILIAWDRMRWLGDPLKGRLPAFVCCCATWLTGMVIALPYPIYTIYVELGDFVPRLNGIGLCVVNLMDDMHEYMRGLFLIMYCGPSVLLAYLYIRTSQELREPDGSFSVTMFEHQTNLRHSQRNSSNASAERPYGGTLITTANANVGIGSSLTTLTNANGHTQSGGLSNRPSTRSYDLYSAELDFCREKRNQRNFGTMAATQVLCLCPLMVLRMARLSMEETYENQKHFDFMYLMFVWIAFLPTVIFPAIFATQMLPRDEQERLRGYFRLSTKRLQKSRSSGASSSSDFTNARKISSRGSSFEKDEFKNTTLVRASFETHNEANAYRYSESENKLKKQQQEQQHKHYGNCENHTRKDYLRHAKQTAVAEKDKHVDKFDKSDVKIKIISEGRSRGSSVVSETPSERKKSNGSAIQKLALEAFDNNSFSNMTASTYCNGNSSLLDDGGLSNFGDGEDSSIVSGMIVSNNNYNATNYSRRSSVLARQKDGSVSELSSLAHLNSSTTLERDLEIMDMLEHKRNSDAVEREELMEVGRQTERRRLPDIEKICQRSPKMNLFDTSTDSSLTNAIASTGSARNTAQMLSTATVTVNHDPLTTDEAYSSATTSNSPMSFSEDGPMVTDEEVPQDFFDEFKPGSEGPQFPVESSQYQYTRRHSRHKTPHFGCPSVNSHRNSKRDSFNSLHGNDLIAGAFGELDPTQPLTKMSVIESRMRRSSGRSSSFSTAGRSSMRSRDLNSTHTMHPELDFRENIFAEL